MSNLKPIDQALWSQILTQQMRDRGISPRALAAATGLGKTTLVERSISNLTKSRGLPADPLTQVTARP